MFMTWSIYNVHRLCPFLGLRQNGRKKERKKDFKNFEQVKLVENLHPNYLPYQFLHILQPFLLWKKIKIFYFFFKSMTKIKLFSAYVVMSNSFALTH